MYIYICVCMHCYQLTALLWPPEKALGHLCCCLEQKSVESAEIFHFRPSLDFFLRKLQRCIHSSSFLTTSRLQQAVMGGEYYKEQEQCWVWKKGLRELRSEREDARELEAEQCGEEPTEFFTRRKISSFLPVTTDVSCTVFGNRSTWQAADRTCSTLAGLLWPSS